LVDFFNAHAEERKMEVIFVSSDRTILDFGLCSILQQNAVVGNSDR
jgi:hypothetical protein